jgi:hypothetical protein
MDLTIFLAEDMLPINSSTLPEYKEMISKIKKDLPVAVKAFDNFGKTQSQFMDNILTVSHHTPLRNAQQILAELNSRVSALKEAQYKIKKSQLKIKKLQRSIEKEEDELEKLELELDLNYELSGIESSKIYVNGAIRAVSNYLSQYNSIMESHGYDVMSEEDFEKEEEKYHITKAFDQALCAARSRGGLIDEGNHIYLSQLGVNGGMAQKYISLFLEQEQKAIDSGGFIGPDFLKGFLNQMAQEFSGCSNKISELKGMKAKTQMALLK